MHFIDRTQYEILQDEDVPYNREEFEHIPLAPLQLDSTHNLDLFFSQIYEYHQLGGYTVIATRYILSALKFVFLFFCLMELTVCVKWTNILDPTTTISIWSDVIVPPAMCWSSLPPLAALVLFIAILVFVYHLIRSSISLSQMWGVRRFCTITLDMPTSDSELNDLTWSEVLRRLLNVQMQMPICRTKVMDELDVYNRILRQTNYFIGMVNREVIPFRFRLPFLSNRYIYLPHFYLLNLKVLLFLNPKSPFVSYAQLRSEYKFLTKRLELADELAKHSRIIGVIGLLLSPVVLLVNILLFLFSNAQQLRFQPTQFFYRSWSNYGRLYLRHFNELSHEFDMRLNQAYNPATEYLQCFQSRLLSVVASSLAFAFGGPSIILLAISLFCEGLIHLHGFLPMIAIGGVVTKICFNFMPTEDAVHFPRASLLRTLAKIHYMPDNWKDSPNSHIVRYEFSQLFQFRAIGAVEEILSPIIVPLIMLFYVPHRCLDIVDFLRNFTTELEGVGDICSFAQLDIPRHGDPDWYPPDATPSSPSSGDGGSDVINGVQHVPAVGGKTELSLMHFHHTNPAWCLPPDSKAFLSAVRKQALNDLQRRQLVQTNFFRGANASTSPLFASLYAAQDFKTVTVMPAQQKPDQAYSSEFLVQAKNISHMPIAMEQPPFGVASALVESLINHNTHTSNTELGPPAEVLSSTSTRQTEGPSTSKSASLAAPASTPFVGTAPTNSLMTSSGLCYNQQLLYQPYASQMEDKAAMNFSYMSQGVVGSISYGEFSTDMDISSLYIHDLHQRRRNACRPSQPSIWLPYAASNARQRSFTSDGLQEELRYQQPGHRYLGGVGRGRGLVSGASVPTSMRSARQFEGLVEEESDALEDNVLITSNLQQRHQQTTSASSSTVTTAVSPHILGDDVQKWPDLPPPTC